MRIDPKEIILVVERLLPVRFKNSVHYDKLVVLLDNAGLDKGTIDPLWVAVRDLLNYSFDGDQR